MISSPIWYFILGIVFLTPACRWRDENASGPQSASVTSRSIHLVFGLAQGFYSCTRRDASVVKRLTTIIDDANKTSQINSRNPVSYTATFIEICFTGGVVDDGGAEVIRYRITSKNQENNAPFTNTNGPDALTHLISSTSTVAATKYPEVWTYLIGHSHGGWLMAKTAAAWSSPSKIRRLFTIDPISYTQCNQTSMTVNALLKGPINLGQKKECTEFPPDLVSTRPTIQSNLTDSWHHFYQTSFPFIHSGSAAPFATVNLEVSFNNLSMTDFAHKAILFDSRVWNIITSKIRNDLKDPVKL
jgi:hypothetical protein